jgi:hypothetical protein
MSYMIIQATVLASAPLVDSMVNDPAARAETKGVPIAADGPTTVR